MTNTEKLSDLLTRAADLARDMEGSDVGELRRQLEVFREDGVNVRAARDAALRECDELRLRMADEGRSRAELLEQLGALRERGDVAGLERSLAEAGERLETAQTLAERAIQDSGRLRRELSEQRARADRAEKHVGDLAASIAILDEVLPAENRSGHEPLQVLQDAYDELEARRRALAGQASGGGVDPFILELDSYRTALADLYRYVYSLPDHVSVPRTGQAARQAELIREKVDELRSARGDDDGQGESLLDIEGLLELARRAEGFFPGKRKR